MWGRGCSIYTIYIDIYMEVGATYRGIYMRVWALYIYYIYMAA